MRRTTAKQTEERIDFSDLPELDLANVKLLRRGPKHPLGPVLPLRGVREVLGKTQTDVADAAEMSQGDVSKLEQRGDAKLSTLRRYVEALGGKLELVVTLPKTGHRFRVDLG